VPSTLVSDIYGVLSNGAEVTDEQAKQFADGLAKLIVDRLAEKGEREFTLRMSNIGKGARQLWYDKKYGKEEVLPPHTILKFIYGDIIEHLLLFLAKLSGHNVTSFQAEVQLDGVKGHIDADIDEVTVDVKSTSTHSFRKFANGTLAEDDPFGYVEQIAGYAKARGTDGAFLAVDKQNGHIAYLHFTKEELDVFKVEDRIAYIKHAIDAPDAPERCYPDEEEGSSGNRALGVNCSYCSHKDRCWSDANGGLGLRTFLYSNGPKFLTKVMREPKVREATF
jgi:hypothetical protein